MRKHTKKNMDYKYINKIDSPADLKKLRVEELPEVCAELRQFIIEALSKNPGHLASSLGAAAGVLVGLSFNAIEPTMGMTMGFKGLAVLIMGGLGNIRGAMMGGFILGIAEVFSVAYGASSYRDAVAFGIIILILFFRPEGLFSKAGKGGRP